jgi:hypothetical protein
VKRVIVLPLAQREIDAAAAYYERQSEGLGARFTEAIIAAVRLARDDLGKPGPKITAAISESVNLTRALLEAVLRRYQRA